MIFVGNEGLEPPTLPMYIGMRRTNSRDPISGTFLDQPFHQMPVLPSFYLSFTGIGLRLRIKNFMIYKLPIFGLSGKTHMLVKVLPKTVFKGITAVAHIVPIHGH